MSPFPRVLVVAATPRELAVDARWIGLVSGAGPVEAAIATALAIAESRPDAVLHVGIAGARRACALSPASLVVGTHALYTDLGPLPPEWAARDIAAPADLLARLVTRFPNAVLRPIGTSGRVGGTSGCEVEAMEGFGVLRAAQRAGVPAIEVRTIANDIEETDRSRWHFDAAFRAITDLTPQLVEAVQEALSARVQHA
jgi:nucleoside phosphorylase